jgi:xanthine dehydrogenase accessory factor
MRTPLPDWPVFGFVDDVRPVLDQVRSRGQPAVLATLVAVEGGGPRPVGTQMVF